MRLQRHFEQLAWASRDGKIKIKHMGTTHLFHTIKMIWNHSVPEELKYKPYKKYRFGKFYTKEYLLKVLPDMLHEILKRPDITQDQLNILLDMNARLSNKLPGTLKC